MEMLKSAKHCGSPKQSSDERVYLWSCRLKFDTLIASRVKPVTLKIGIQSFPASRSALKRQCGQQAGKFIRCAVGKGTYRYILLSSGRQIAGNLKRFDRLFVTEG